MIKDAVQLNEKGIKIKRAKPVAEKPAVLQMPDYLQAAFDVYPKAKAVFESKPSSFHKEYISWISDAKTAERRQKRINEGLAWILE